MGGCFMTFPLLVFLFYPDVCVFFVHSGRGGDHAFWPSDINLIDRNTINGKIEEKRTMFIEQCVIVFVSRAESVFFTALADQKAVSP